MKPTHAKRPRLARVAMLSAFVATSIGLAPTPARAQLQQIGVDPWGVPMCAGPRGPGRCADIAAWMQRGGDSGQFGGAIPAPPGSFNFGGSSPAPPAGNFGMGPIGPGGLPTSIVPHDGQLVAEIAQSCGGNPKCIAAAWASVEIQRCANGVFVPGGCFGPNGEIAKVGRVILNDIANGPGSHHDIVGKEGWVCENVVSIFGSC